MHARGLALGWGLFLLAIVIWLAIKMAAAPILDANLMGLLPSVDRSPAVSAAADRYRERFERRIVLLVGANNATSAKSAAKSVEATLTDSGQFEEVVGSFGEDGLDHAIAFYFPLRFELLSGRARALLTSGALAAFEQDLLSRYFSPMSAVTSDLVEQDPLQLLPSFLEERTGKGLSGLEIEDGFLLTQDGGKTYVLISASLKDSPFSFALQGRLAPVFSQLAAEQDLLRAGVFFHAVAGAATAKHEISRVGLGALIGIIALFLLVFRSPHPLGLSLLAIAVGCLGGFSACLLLFGQVHLLTLVFGASLVGISVDYSLHYFCDHFRLNQDWSPDAALRHVFPGITLGLATSVIGFAGLLFTSFPGMQQVAVFSGMGLIFAYTCVLAFHPLVRGAVPYRHMAAPLRWSSAYIRRSHQVWTNGAQGPWPWRVLPALAFLGLGLLGISRLTPVDDIRQLQSVNPEIQAEETRLRGLLGEDTASQFFLLEGQDEGELLAREEDLVAALQSQAAAGNISGYQAISELVPSQKIRAENRALIASLLDGNDTVLGRLAAKVGLPDTTVDRYAAAFTASPVPTPDLLPTWLASPLAGPYRHLWLGELGRGYVSAVSLQGLRDPTALTGLSDPNRGVTFVDNVGDLSRLFGESRRQAGILTLVSYLFVGFVLLLRYGVRGGLAVMVAPLAAAGTSLGVQGLLGEPLSLFNVLALLLVLGIGVDYGIFFRETGAESPSTLVAIALSSITTLLAFGLLALSETTAVHAFGLTVLIGITVAFLLAPTAGLGSGERRGVSSA